MQKPLIGVTPLFDRARDSYWMLPGYFLALEQAGAVPVMLPLSNDEAALFSASVEDNLAAWQKLCAAIPLRRPHLAPVLDGILDDVRKTAKFVYDMFLGWIPAELTPAYGASFLAAKGALEKIWEEVGV